MRRWMTLALAGLGWMAAQGAEAQISDSQMGGAAASAPQNTSQQRVLAASDLRPGLSLSGLWRYSIDAFRAGMVGFHGETPNVTERRWAETNVMQALRDDNRALFEYDMDSAPVASLPSSWMTHAPEMRYYQGLVWYQRRFTAQPLAGKRQFLRFEAANYKARVYLNGQLLGEHEGGFTPFSFEVTGKVRAGENQVTVGVDSQVTDTSVPPPVTDWEHYGGLTRDVRLIETPQTYVDDAWVRLTREGRVAVDVRLDGPVAANQSVTLSIPEIGVTLRGRTDENGAWKDALAAPRRLQRWNPGSPVLYDVEVTAADDVWKDRIGFRTIETRGADILLNGRPIFMSGVSLHEEEFGLNPSRAITQAAARALLLEARDGLNANFVRLAHYPHTEVTTRLADELGLLVWSEIPVYWRIDWSNPQTLAVARNMLAENVMRDRNRASIVIWSIANETPVSDARNRFLTTLAQDVRAMDDTRLLSAALLTKRTEEGHPVLTLDDPAAPLLDIVAINTYNGWYGADRLSDLASIEWRLPSDKPLIFSEFGADAKAGFHDLEGDPQKFSEEYQAEYYRQTLAMAERIPTLRGLSPWILKDFRSPRRQTVFQQGWNRKGLVSETGQRKLAFDVLAQFYADQDPQGAQ